MRLLLQKVPSTHAQGLPLEAEAASNVFKSIFLDIGLMQYICGISSNEFLNQKDLLVIYRGGLDEQFVGQQLLLYGGSENERLYYWNRPNKSCSLEVDFVLVRNGEIIPRLSG